MKGFREKLLYMVIVYIMTTFRQITSPVLSNKQKVLLRTFFNEHNGKAYTRISQITNFMGYSSSDDTYEALRDLYNSDILVKQKAQRNQRDRLAREAKSFLQLGELSKPIKIKVPSKPKMSINRLGGFVKNWLKTQPFGQFEITLKSMTANVSRSWKFTNIYHFSNWYDRLNQQYEDSAGNITSSEEKDLFKNIIIENIKLITGGCNTKVAKTIGLKSSFYKYKLFNPISRGNNCLFACLNHIRKLDLSYHNLRKQFKLESGKEISISQAYHIIIQLKYNVDIICYDTNEELDDTKQYIVYQDSHYYVLESFESICKKDKKTKRGLLTFDFETRETEEYHIIKATGKKMDIIQDSLCCVYYRPYKQVECKSLKFITGEKSSARQFIDWLNEESKNGRTYNVLAHNGGKFDFYFIIQNLTTKELLDSEPHFRGTTIISLNYRGNLFKDTCCFLTDSLKNLSKNFKVSDGKIVEFNLHGKILSSEQLCFYKPELKIKQFLELQHTDIEYWDLYEKYCLYDCIALFQIWEKFTICVNGLIEKISPYLLAKCPLMSSTTIGSHSKKIITEINKYNDKPNKFKRDLEKFTGISYVNVDLENNRWEKRVDYEKYNFLCNFKRGGISHCNKPGKHLTGITGVDIASQYPASLIYARIPTGESYWVDNYDFTRYGFYCIENMVFDSYLLKPIALGSKTESLNWATNNMKELYVDSYMLRYIIENYGLKSFNVKKDINGRGMGLVSNQDIDGSKIFGEYIGKFYDEKKLQDTYKSSGNELYNEALRSTIKLYLNSLTGKLVENPAIHFSLKFDESSLRLLNGEGITKHHNEDKINDWLVAGIMVYSYSKRLLFEYIKCLPNNSDDVIHIETDGIYFNTELLPEFTNNLKNYKGKYPCMFGEDLGNLKIEKTTYAGQVAYFLGKKFYCITMSDEYNTKPRDEKDKNIYRVKGIPQTTIEDDGKRKYLVDVKMYEDIYKGETLLRSFKTLKKELFCEKTNISSYTMTRTIKGQTNYKLYNPKVSI